MDNYHFNVTSDSQFIDWMLLCANKREAVGYKVFNRKPQLLVLYWTIPSNINNYCPFLTPLSGSALAYTVEAWLLGVDYETEPDQDGINTKGFRIFNEAWGHVEDERQAFMGIQPVWAMYGK